MSQLTRAEIEELAAVRCAHGQVLSCYVDLTAEEGMQRHWRATLRQVVDALRRAMTHDEVALHDFEANYHAVQDVLESGEFEGAAGLAIFSAKLCDYMKVVKLSVPVPTELRLAPTPYLVPLLCAFFRLEDRYLVIEAESQEARIFAGWPGSAEMLAEIKGEPLRRPYSDPSKGGWCQQDISKRRQEAHQRFQDEVLAAVLRHWNSGRYDSVILAGRADALETLKNILPQDILDRVVHEASCPESDSTEMIEKIIGDIINVVRREQQRVLHTEFRRRTREGSGFAAGPRDVLAWLDTRPPDAHACVMLGTDRGRVVSRCTICRHLNWYEVTACPKCQGASQPANLWEELLLRVLDHRWRVAFFDDHPSLLPFEGVSLMFCEEELTKMSE